MVDFYNTYFLPSSPTRAKLSVHLIAQGSSGDAAAAKTADVEAVAVDGKKSEPMIITDVRSFKATLPLSEGARPVKDLVEFEELEPKL